MAVLAEITSAKYLNKNMNKAGNTPAHCRPILLIPIFTSKKKLRATEQRACTRSWYGDNDWIRDRKFSNLCGCRYFCALICVKSDNNLKICWFACLFFFLHYRDARFIELKIVASLQVHFKAFWQFHFKFKFFWSISESISTKLKLPTTNFKFYLIYIAHFLSHPDAGALSALL